MLQVTAWEPYVVYDTDDEDRKCVEDILTMGMSFVSCLIFSVTLGDDILPLCLLCCP